MAGNNLGEINGPWAWAFKANMALLLPYLIGFGIWVVGQIHGIKTEQAMVNRTRFTQKDSQELIAGIDKNAYVIDNISKVLSKLDSSLDLHISGHK
tara:strand:+ start:10984 stop:11271 length:288 start_codon:yes stop_codon:yes gene_type:complete